MLLAIQGLSVRAKSASPMKGASNRVAGLARRLPDTHEETKAQLKDGDSLVLIRDYVESLMERGRTAPA